MFERIRGNPRVRLPSPDLSGRRASPEEEFSPLLYHLFASYVASYLVERLGRLLFQGDHPELLQSVNEYYASLQREEGFTTTTKEATMEKR